MQPSLCGDWRHLFHGYDGNLPMGTLAEHPPALKLRRDKDARPSLAAAFSTRHGGADGAAPSLAAAAFSTGHGGADVRLR